MSPLKVAIIGAGPAGMSAAITAAKRGHEVTLFERNQEPGKKLLMTGNGRCNITNADAGDPGFYHEGEALGFSGGSLARRVTGEFDLSKMLSFLGSIGISTKCRDGYYYPSSDQASSVRDAFCIEMKSLGVEIKTGIKITGIAPSAGGTLPSAGGFVPADRGISASAGGITPDDGGISASAGGITPDDGGFTLNLGLSDGSMEQQYFDRVIICCGSKACPDTGSDGFGYKLCKKLGIELSPVHPALTKLFSDEPLLQMLDGVRAPGHIDLYINGSKAAGESGNIQFLKKSVSGIVTFQLSSIAARSLAAGDKVSLLIDTLEDMDEEELADLIRSRRDRASGFCGDKRTVEEGLVTILNSSLITCFTTSTCLKNRLLCSLSDEEIASLAHAMKHLKVDITGVGGYSQSQVCSGGIRSCELDDSLMIKKYPGLYAAGELLDVDGKCGGFNLHFAIASGCIAGRLSN